MKALDRFLQKWRIRRAVRELPRPVRLIDIGAFHGELFGSLGKDLREGFGIEPLLEKELSGQRYRILPGFFPAVRPPSIDWDAVTMLAVLEHIPAHEQGELAQACFGLLRPGGFVVVTVPSPQVDRILAILSRLRLIDGMSLEEHYGFSPDQVVPLFLQAGFLLRKQRRFQLGLNHLFVFAKPRDPA